MKIAREEIERSFGSFRHSIRKPRRHSIERRISDLRRSMRQSIENELQAPMVLLDESLRCILSFETFQASFIPSPERREFAFHISKLRGDILATRELIVLGQESCALALARVFIEDLEIAMALAVDPEFALAYGSSESASDFWSKHIGYGKIYSKVERFLTLAGGNANSVEASLRHHKNLKTLLSEHVHTTTSTVFRSAFPSPLHTPGVFINRPLGAIGDNLWPLCLVIADEVQVFLAGCVNMFISPSPPLALADYKPSRELEHFVASVHVLQELNIKHLEPLWNVYTDAIRSWKEVMRQHAA